MGGSFHGYAVSHNQRDLYFCDDGSPGLPPATSPIGLVAPPRPTWRAMPRKDRPTDQRTRGLKGIGRITL